MPRLHDAETSSNASSALGSSTKTSYLAMGTTPGRLSKVMRKKFGIASALSPIHRDSKSPSFRFTKLEEDLEPIIPLRSDANPKPQSKNSPFWNGRHDPTQHISFVEESTTAADRNAHRSSKTPKHDAASPTDVVSAFDAAFVDDAPKHNDNLGAGLFEASFSPIKNDAEWVSFPAGSNERFGKDGDETKAANNQTAEPKEAEETQEDEKQAKTTKEKHVSPLLPRSQVANSAPTAAGSSPVGSDLADIADIADLIHISGNDDAIGSSKGRKKSHAQISVFEDETSNGSSGFNSSSNSDSSRGNIQRRLVFAGSSDSDDASKDTLDEIMEGQSDKNEDQTTGAKGQRASEMTKDTIAATASDESADKTADTAPDSVAGAASPAVTENTSVATGTTSEKAGSPSIKQLGDLRLTGDLKRVPRDGSCAGGTDVTELTHNRGSKYKERTAQIVLDLFLTRAEVEMNRTEADDDQQQKKEQKQLQVAPGQEPQQEQSVIADLVESQATKEIEAVLVDAQKDDKETKEESEKKNASRENVDPPNDDDNQSVNSLIAVEQAASGGDAKCEAEQKNGETRKPSTATPTDPSMRRGSSTTSRTSDFINEDRETRAGVAAPKETDAGTDGYAGFSSVGGFAQYVYSIGHRIKQNSHYIGKVKTSISNGIQCIGDVASDASEDLIFCRIANPSQADKSSQEQGSLSQLGDASRPLFADGELPSSPVGNSSFAEGNGDGELTVGTDDQSQYTTNREDFSLDLTAIPKVGTFDSKEKEASS